MNAIVSPIPTKVYKPATVTPRQTSAMTLSGWSLICLSGIAPLLGCRPTRIDHAGGGKLFRAPRYKRVQTEKWELHEISSTLDIGRYEQVSSLPPGNDLLTTTGVNTLAPKYAAQTKALKAELPKDGILANGPTIAMNAGEFEGVQPDHHGL